MQRHFLSDGTVAQLYSQPIRPHAFQRLVDVVQQYVRTVVLPNLDLRTRGKTHRIALVEVEPGFALSNVVPNMRVLDLCQPALSLARHRYTSMLEYHHILRVQTDGTTLLVFREQVLYEI